MFNLLLQFTKKYTFIKLIDNPDYDRIKNMTSTIVTRNIFIGGSYLCEADLYITNPNIIKYIPI